MNAPILTDLQIDALTELVNLGVSNAATSLSELVREEVFLSVPRVSVVTRDQAIANLREHEAKRLVGVHQDFDGDIRGRALLIFPEVRSMELIRALVGAELPLDDIMELEQEALAETGNILLNGCLSTMANSLHRSLKISLPEVVHGDGTDFFAAMSNSDETVLFIYINFAVKQRDIQGFLAMILDLPSLVMLQKLLDGYIERSTGQSPTAGHVE
ncbi:MAG TPA: chemotaxis protein CheX [Steroidobacteraceae bacterium]|nr:chemotaxis protein CheX [Steroidobacteraceae bacterium]